VRGTPPVWIALALLAPVAAQAGDSTGSRPGFQRRQLTDRYYSEAVTTGDFDNDGAVDIASGPFIYRGPAFEQKIDFKKPRPFPVGGYSDQFHVFADDIDRDGDIDLLEVGFPGLGALFYANPGDDSGDWRRKEVAPNIDMEAPRYLDMDGDGRPELLCANGGRLGWFAPAKAEPGGTWSFRAISAKSPMWTSFTHGLGAGDLNGDGRPDLLTAFGWLAQPTARGDTPDWTHHEWSLGGSGGAQMYAADVDGDGDADVITSINAHGFGLGWYENVKVDGGELRFREHEIMPRTVGGDALSFSQLHALGLADLDGDELPDIVTGKCFMAHNGHDPGWRDPAVLYWFRLRRDDEGARFEPHLVDDDSGVGRQIAIADANGDRRPDIVTANKKGVFLFLNRL